MGPVQLDGVDAGANGALCRLHEAVAHARHVVRRHLPWELATWDRTESPMERSSPTGLVPAPAPDRLPMARCAEALRPAWAS